MKQPNIESATSPAQPKHQWLTKLLRYGIPFVVTVGLCWMLFSKQDFGSMLATIRDNCRWQWIWASLGLSVVSHIIRAMRWRIQLQAIGVRVGLYPVVLSIFGTYAVNLVFPRLGELWRTSYIAQRQDAPFDAVFGSMVADRLADTLTVALLILLTFVLAGPQLSDYIMDNRASYEALMSAATSPWIWCGVAAAIAAIWMLIIYSRKSRLLQKVADFARGLWRGFAVVTSMPGRGRWLLLTAAIWGCYYVQLYLAFFAFPETALMVERHGATAVLLCFVLSSISMGVPSNGGIGPWQWAIIFGISLYSADIPGLTTEMATSFANLVMGTETLLLILLGLFTFISIAIGRRRLYTSNSKTN